MVDLVFRSPFAPGQPVELVFGDDGAPSNDVAARVAIRLPGPRVAMRMVRRKTATVHVRLPGPRVAVIARYESRTDRPTVGRTLSGFGSGAPARAGIAGVYQQAVPAQARLQVQVEPAQTVGVASRQIWQQARAMAAPVRAIAQTGRAVAAEVRQAWQEAVRMRNGNQQRWQEGVHTSAALLQLYQETLRRRSAAASDFTDGRPAGTSVRRVFGHGRGVRIVLRTGYEEARRPVPGGARPVVPPVEPPCYVPAVGGPVDLVFCSPWAGGAQLLFVCCKGDGPNPEPPRYVIPLLRVYMTVHSIDAVLLPSLERVPLQSINITTNDDEYGWTMSASGKLSLLDQLAPQQGVPQQIRVTIDGIQWMFVVDPPARTRKFPEHTVQVTGRSVTSLLGAPYFSSTDWVSSIPQSAQQLLLQALDLTGVGLDWQLDDWLVPADIWSHSGTPLSVAQRIAEAAGGVVRSHRYEPQLQIAPRFPHMPWAWGDAVPDVRMPAQIITSDSLQSIHAARYNAVYVAGTGQGLPLGHVVRAGTAGDRLAPQVSDALITDIVAARLRGQSVLAASAITHQQPITVPLLTGSTNPGLILPGYLIEVQEPAETWRGLVRGITVSVDAPAVRQTLDVERAIA